MYLCISNLCLYAHVVLKLKIDLALEQAFICRPGFAFLGATVASFKKENAVNEVKMIDAFYLALL
jgi:hypothetical protein